MNYRRMNSVTDELMNRWLNEDSVSHSESNVLIFFFFFNEKDEINLTIYFYFEKESFVFTILDFKMWGKKRKRN